MDDSACNSLRKGTMFMRGVVLLLCFLVGQLGAQESPWKDEDDTYGCRGKPADVVFALDASNSIWPADFFRQLDFVNNLTSLFTIGSNNIMVGVLTYAEHPRLQFHLDYYQTSANLHAAIDNIYQDGGYVTRTADGLRYLRNMIKTSSAGTKRNVTKIGIVITDGLSDNTTETAIEAERVREAGIHLFAVGVGKNRNVAELEAIASRPLDYYLFQVESYRHLESIKQLLAIKTCQVTDPPSTLVPPSTTKTTTTRPRTTKTTTRKPTTSTPPRPSRTTPPEDPSHYYEPGIGDYFSQPSDKTRSPGSLIGPNALTRGTASFPTGLPPRVVTNRAGTKDTSNSNNGDNEKNGGKGKPGSSKDGNGKDRNGQDRSGLDKNGQIGKGDGQNGQPGNGQTGHGQDRNGQERNNGDRNSESGNAHGGGGHSGNGNAGKGPGRNDLSENGQGRNDKTGNDRGGKDSANQGKTGKPNKNDKNGNKNSADSDRDSIINGQNEHLFTWDPLDDRTNIYQEQNGNGIYHRTSTPSRINPPGSAGKPSKSGSGDESIDGGTKHPGNKPGKNGESKNNGKPYTDDTLLTDHDGSKYYTDESGRKITISPFGPHEGRNNGKPFTDDNLLTDRDGSKYYTDKSGRKITISPFGSHDGSGLPKNVGPDDNDADSLIGPDGGSSRHGVHRATKRPARSQPSVPPGNVYGQDKHHGSHDSVSPYKVTYELAPDTDENGHGHGGKIWRLSAVDGNLMFLGRPVDSDENEDMLRSKENITEAFTDGEIIYGLDKNNNTVKIGCVFNGTHYIGHWVEDEDGNQLWYGYPKTVAKDGRSQPEVRSPRGSDTDPYKTGDKKPDDPNGHLIKDKWSFEVKGTRPTARGSFGSDDKDNDQYERKSTTDKYSHRRDRTTSSDRDIANNKHDERIGGVTTSSRNVRDETTPKGSSRKKKKVPTATLR